MTRSRADIVEACLIGTAFGDALGLPYENVSARRAARLLGPPDRMRLFFGRGMVSDDAEHAVLTTAALIESNDDVELFRRCLARRLRGWLLTLPAGAGAATIKGIARTMIGIPPSRSGVRSAGNGPLMRALPLGLLAPAAGLSAFAKASTLVTHRDERAVRATILLAQTARTLADRPTVSLTEIVASAPSAVASVAADDLDDRLDALTRSVASGEGTADFAARLCRRPGFVSGYAYETLPVALHAVFTTPAGGLREGVRRVIACGGDTDSTAALVGGLLAIRDGVDASVRHDVGRLLEWPVSVALIAKLAAATTSGALPRLPTVRRLPRSVLFWGVVVAWTGRRVLPPY